MNYFSPKSAAQRYARGRPYFHPLVMQRIRAQLALTVPVPRAIDVGCGTGLSALALKELAKQIVGVDKAVGMLALAPSDPKIGYIVAAAEQLPVRSSTFDLMTLSSAFHWLDRARFFAEARRVLRPGGWLVVYDNYFLGQMVEQPGFHAWFHDVYLTTYPSPPRAPVSFTPDTSALEGFHLLHHEQYTNEIRFSLDGLINYLVTQSNVTAAVEGGTQSIEAVKWWLREQLAHFFGTSGEASCMFGGPIWYLRPIHKHLPPGHVAQ